MKELQKQFMVFAQQLWYAGDASESKTMKQEE